MKIKAYIPKEFQHTFMGFPLNAESEINKFNKGIDRRRQLAQRKRFYHKSRGKNKLKDEIYELLSDCMDTDYIGDDDYPITSINKDSAVNEIIKFLGKKGVLKYLL